MTGTTDRAPFPGLDDDERVRHKGELVYPNLMLSLSADHVAAFMLVPKAPDRTLVVVDLLFHPDEIAKPDFDPSDAVDFWDLVNRQDWAVCEWVQRGMSSRRFQRLVRADGGREPRHPALRRRAPRARTRSGRRPRRGRTDDRRTRLGRRRRRARGARAAAAYWASRRAGRPRPGARAVRARPPHGASRGRQPDHPPLSYHRRDYVRLDRARLRDWAEVEARERRAGRVRTGGLDVVPRETAAASRSTSASTRGR